MRLGLGSFAYAWAIGVPGHRPEHPMTVQGLLERAAQHTVRRVQLADNLPLGHLSQPEVRALRQLADELHVALEVGTRGIAPEHLRHYLQLAEQLGSPMVRVVVGSHEHHPDDDEVMATLRRVVPDFAAAGVVLAVENHDRFPAATLARVIDHLSSTSVGICLDTANSLGCLEGLDTVLAALGPHVVNLHVKDITIRRATHSMGFVVEGCPAGAGQLELPRLLREVGAGRPTASAILELWPPPEATLAATIAKEEAWVKQSLNYLRPLLEAPA